MLKNQQSILTKDNGSCLPASIFTQDEQTLQQYQCPIMWGVLHRPVKAECGHVFCSKCIATAIRMDARARCPVCRQNLGRLQKDEDMEKTIQSMSTRCPHQDCSWTGKLKSLKHHLKKGCKHGLHKCKTCGKKFEAVCQLAEHKTVECRVDMTSYILHNYSSDFNDTGTSIYSHSSLPLVVSRLEDVCSHGDPCGLAIGVLESLVATLLIPCRECSIFLYQAWKKS